ncbi:fimbrial protein [Stenotrophomonas cyclobalanopsidis]|uniref:Fimbrial protein n=1 Tax=Stenotrophomonas cyclobalanopsidis TaxID=2771362 RepID=A0ABQ6T381_9GAMM|nr:fimbrial protein [Stenotrophomonas cyclobalanopsidis]
MTALRGSALGIGIKLESVGAPAGGIAPNSTKEFAAPAGGAGGWDFRVRMTRLPGTYQGGAVNATITINITYS